MFPPPRLLFYLIFCLQAVRCFQSTRHTFHIPVFTRATPRPDNSAVLECKYLQQAPKKLLIHWKGEGLEGYSMQFRRRELQGALEAVLGRRTANIHLEDALQYTGKAEMPQVKLIRFEQAMQYLTLEDSTITRNDIILAARRSSLVHAIFEIISQGDTYRQLSVEAMKNNGFADMMSGRENGNATWCLRVRKYSPNDGSKERRHGMRTRSMQREKEALDDMKSLLLTLGGPVNLKQPDCKIFVFDGLRDQGSALTRRLAQGARVSSIAPPTRICVTNTPLCPMAAFIMCNMGRLRPNQRLMDPFAGSCAILLAAAMIEPTVHSVGIEIAHDGIIDRGDIRHDFQSRDLPLPTALLQGDCSDDHVLQETLSAVDDIPFDLIVTDPPYGIRESIRDDSGKEGSPIDSLLIALARRRRAAQPVLRPDGGRIVCFLPSYRPPEEDDIEGHAKQNESFLVMPSDALLNDAGLRMIDLEEQPLNDRLSRWLVVFESI